jgi:signal transduction histidine kinase
MKIVLAAVLSIVVLRSGFAQNYSVIKPLEEELKTCKETARLVEIHLKLLFEYEIFNTEKSLFHGVSAWNEAGKDSMKQEMTTAAYRLGCIYQFDENDADRASQWLLKALTLAEQEKDSARIADCAYNLGLVLFDNGETERGKQYFNKATDFAVRRKDYAMIVIAEVALGKRLKTREEKLGHFQKALDAANLSINDTLSLALTWSTLGEFYREIKEETPAKYWFEKVFQLLNGKVLHYQDHHQLELFANSCLRTGRYNESIEAAERIVSLCNNPGSSEWYSLEGMKLLAEGYFYNGYDSLAFWTLMKYSTKKDSLQEIRNNSRAQRNMQIRQLEFEAQQQAQEVKLSETKQQYERYLKYILNGSFLALLILAIYLYRERRREYHQNKQLARLNQTKDKLLSIISHDVRSPIQALQNIINLFEQDIASKEDVHMVTKQVSARVQGMAQGLDNLFYWAQSQQMELKAYPETFNLSELVSVLIDFFGERIRKKELSVLHNQEEPCFLTEDMLHTRLIISNILVNAIKFSPLKGIINITCSKDKEGNCILSMADNGSGIPDADIAKIFDPAVRYTRPGTADEPGSGLGLSLTRDLLLLNSNNIVINSYQGKGTRVDLIFNRKKISGNSSSILPDS